ncbi:hypothetical protein LH991_16245 [Schleiferilactobacillus harbinensis]|uniref:YopX family protein n=1 Tax=Schleiferilactobacillus harbinensis TaxID=304207 RepID=UPI00047F423C|nr:YopX family protein [Schleiferilactobacillus harbinensis]QFR62514.1 hypothetical protein LH991_00095 [Schleiferilactobacillus harbinensis]QFR65375.1 hypothetical protein LH991_16245 [Schleiferilactobacillus harbinensis]
MKREIKFRAWNGHNMFNNIQVGAMYLGDLIADPQWHLMQYTNFKDKNGREIYECDVLDIGLRNQDGKPVMAPVSYQAYAAGYVLDNGGNGIWQRLTENCEVVGNIYENPDLLEAQHD